jgi:hypothetical protein
LTPKLADPGPVADDAAGVELEDEQPAAAAATRAVAENSANVLFFMCRFLQDVFGAKAQRGPDRPGQAPREGGAAQAAGHGGTAWGAGRGACGPSSFRVSGECFLCSYLTIFASRKSFAFSS